MGFPTSIMLEITHHGYSAINERTSNCMALGIMSYSVMPFLGHVRAVTTSVLKIFSIISEDRIYYLSHNVFEAVFDCINLCWALQIFQKIAKNTKNAHFRKKPVYQMGLYVVGWCWFILLFKKSANSTFDLARQVFLYTRTTSNIDKLILCRLT